LVPGGRLRSWMEIEDAEELFQQTFV